MVALFIYNIIDVSWLAFMSLQQQNEATHANRRMGMRAMAGAARTPALVHHNNNDRS